MSGSRPPSFYDAQWEGPWGALQEFGPQHRHHRRVVEAMLRDLPFESALDAGCGAGQHLEVLARLNPWARLAGADVSPRALALAAARRPGEYHALDLERAALPGTYDLVTCFQVLEHLADDAAAVRHLAAMARRWVLVSTMQGRMAEHERAIGHVRRYARPGLEALLRAAGLTPLHAVEWGFPFYAWFEAAQARAPHPHAPPRFGPGWRAAAAGLHALYFLNAWTRGPVLFVLSAKD